jgi:hypothetical protein
MLPKSHRETRFPGHGQIAYLKAAKEEINTNRCTRFPSGTDLRDISITQGDKPPIDVKRDAEEVAQLPSRLPLSVNPPSTALARPLLVINV